MKKKLMILFIILFFAVLVFGVFSTFNKIGTSKKIEEENVEITVNSVENIVITDAYPESDNGDYIKINLTVKNNNNKEFMFFPYNLEIVGDKSSIGYYDVISTESDNSFINNEKYKIEANSSNTGDVFFKGKLSKKYKLKYIVRGATDTGIASNSYYFELN